MANDPSFVKMAAPWQGRIVADVRGSGWSLSGLAVAPFPKNDRQAARYVRAMLQAARLVPASAEQYDACLEVKEVAAQVAAGASNGPTGHQEAILQAKTRELRAKLQEFYDGGDLDLSDEEEPETLESLLKLKKDELEALAADRGVTLPSGATKDDIAEALLNA